MKISIITICKNEVNTIKKTLLSIFEQTYKNFELVVVDGASTDGTLEIIEQYRGKITHFISEPDKGVYNAMNKGIRLASGDLLYFLNASDSLFSDCVFEKVIKAFSKEPEAQISFGNVNLINSKIGDTSSFLTDFRERYDDYFVFKDAFLWHQTMFFKRELFEKYGLYDESFSISGDCEKNMRFLLKENLLAIYIPITCANFALDGLSSNPKNYDAMMKEHRRLFRMYYEKPKFGFTFGKIARLLKFFAPELCRAFFETKLYKHHKLREAELKKRKLNVKLVEV